MSIYQTSATTGFYICVCDQSYLGRSMPARNFHFPAPVCLRCCNVSGNSSGPVHSTSKYSACHVKEYSWLNQRPAPSLTIAVVKEARREDLPLLSLKNSFLQAVALLLASTYAKSQLISSYICALSWTFVSLVLTCRWGLSFLAWPWTCCVTDNFPGDCWAVTDPDHSVPDPDPDLLLLHLDSLSVGSLAVLLHHTLLLAHLTLWSRWLLLLPAILFPRMFLWVLLLSFKQVIL